MKFTNTAKVIGGVSIASIGASGTFLLRSRSEENYEFSTEIEREAAKDDSDIVALILPDSNDNGNILFFSIFPFPEHEGSYFSCEVFSDFRQDQLNKELIKESLHRYLNSFKEQENKWLIKPEYKRKFLTSCSKNKLEDTGEVTIISGLKVTLEKDSSGKYTFREQDLKDIFSGVWVNKQIK